MIEQARFSVAPIMDRGITHFRFAGARQRSVRRAADDRLNFAHLKFPYVENHLNFIVDFHLVYAAVIVYPIAHRAGHVWGLDGLLEQLHMVDHYPALRPLVE
ncbi:MAG: hypothetical protein ACLPXW_24115 [Xanthobacteraceae bacterium]